MSSNQLLSGIFAGAIFASCAQAQGLLPDPVVPSEIRVGVEYVGTMPAVEGPGLSLGTSGFNLQSPVSTDSGMYFIDHFDAIWSANRNGQQLRKIFSIADGDAPDGLIFEMPVKAFIGGEETVVDYKQRQAVFNVAPSQDPTKLYVVLVANVGSTLPDVPRHRLPDPGTWPFPVGGPCCAFPFGPPTSSIANLYDIKPEETASFFIPFIYPGIEHQILYEFTMRDHKLVDPRPIVIFDSQGGPLHHGAGLIPLKDGRLLYWTGDAVPFGLSGLEASQSLDSHLSKIMLIDPATGAAEIAASGVRNVQHVDVVKQRRLREDWIAFADIGGWTAEEVNTIRLADLVDTSVVENFGWGTNLDDGLSREGTFYVGTSAPEAVAFSLFTPVPTGAAPVPEPGFVSPHAQYTRPGNGDPLGGVAASGPVTSNTFRDLTMVFSDLSSARLYGTTDPIDAVDATVRALTIVDELGLEYDTLLEFTGLARVDPRFFRFPDGTAGLLLEATGDYYRLTELK